MAWFSLYKWFIRFRKIPYTDYIQWYRKKLFDKWYEGLTEEQRDRYDKYIERKDKERIKQAKVLLGFMKNVSKYYKM